MKHNDKRSHLLAQIGLGFATFVGAAFLIAGICGLSIDNQLQECQSQPEAQIQIPPGFDLFRGFGCFKIKNSSFLLFLLNTLIAICTDAVGYVHGTTLKWTLARENKLEFSTNLRLYSASRKILSPNGYIANIIMLILLVLSYSSASYITMASKIRAQDLISTTTTHTSDFEAITPSYTACVVLGASLLIQTAIAIAAMRETSVKTWNSNCLAIAEALMDQGLSYQPGNCMRGVGEKREDGPLLPLERQISAWSAHPQAKWVVLLSWSPIIVCSILSGVSTNYWLRFVSKGEPLGPWTLASPDTFSGQLPRTAWLVQWSKGSSLPTFMAELFAMVGLQLSIIVSLHCSELVVTLYRDEEQWRVAYTGRGTAKDRDCVRNALYSWPSVLLFLCKPALNWLFGQAITPSAAVWVYFPIQIFNLTGAFLLFAIFLTFLATKRPRGPQPSAYGHCQTLVNLIDEWNSKMFWGHKPTEKQEEEGEEVLHAGTSSKKLGLIQMRKPYAGTGDAVASVLVCGDDSQQEDCGLRSSYSSRKEVFVDDGLSMDIVSGNDS
jgi:hypothetical protein